MGLGALGGLTAFDRKNLAPLDGTEDTSEEENNSED